MLITTLTNSVRSTGKKNRTTLFFRTESC